MLSGRLVRSVWLLLRFVSFIRGDLMKLAKAALIAALFASAAPAAAANFSFTGNFNRDDNVQTFNFAVGAASNITLRSWGYAGGVNAAGQTISRGGFDTILALFDSAGVLINQNDDGGCSLVAADAVTGACWDTYLTASLSAGNYFVAVMQYDNFANGPNFANGFVRTGQGNFTGGISGCNSTQNSFEDVSGNQAGCQRTNAWAFDILNVEQAALVPEPATWAMMIAGFGLVGGAMRRRISVAYSAA